jgi:imidazolonepropionase-like amidohydrolase
MFLLKNGNTFTPKGWTKGFSVLTKGGKIVDVSKNIKKPAKAKVVDCKGLYIIPGIVEAHSHLGVFEEGAGIMGYHYNEGSDPITPQVRAMDAVFPRDPGFRYALEGGITTAVANPGSANLIGGLNVVVKCYPNAQTVEEMIIKEPEGMKFALGENPFRFYGKDQGKPPKTRMGSAAITRAALMKCRDYIAKKKKAKRKKEVFEEDLGMENLSLVLNRKIPARWHCHRADDILTALRIAKEFNFKVTIEHTTEGHFIVDELKKRKIDCVTGPINTAMFKQELRERSIALPGILNRAGIRVSITTDHPVAPIWTLPILAAMSVKGGMDEVEALRAITIYPAQIIGLSKKIGSLEKGKDADIAIFDGHPLDARSHCVRTYLDGKELHKM